MGLLALLIRLFPAPFAERFGPGIMETLARERTWARERGRLSGIWFLVTAAWDLIRNALAERWHPTWAHSHAEERPMRWNWLAWWSDLRHALRTLRRSPGFTVTAVGMLALAMGANASLLTVLKTVVLDPLPFAHADRLVYIAASAPGTDFPDEFGVAPEFFLQYGESPLIEDLSSLNSFTATLQTSDRVERVRMSWPTNSMYSTLGATPILGRVPVEADENSVVVISYALWQTWFGGDSAVLGRSYQIAGATRTVVGVMGPRFHFPDDGTLLWIASYIRADSTLRPGRFGGPLVARMRPGTKPEDLAADLTALSKRLPERFGGSADYARLIEKHRAIVRPLTTQLVGQVSRPIWILVAAVGIVFLIACANVANLFMVRAEGRHRDLAVRTAIGAARGQLIRLQMAEAMVIAALAGLGAVALAAMLLPVLVHAAPEGVPRIGDVHLGGTTLLFTMGVVVVAAFACGLLPAIRASAPRMTRLGEGGRGATRSHHWLRNGLVVAQTALALALLIGSGLLVRSFWKMQRVDPGYDTEDVFTFQIAPAQARLFDGPTYARFSLDFMDRLRALPGVESVGLVENVPLNESTAGTRVRSEEMGDTPDGGPFMRYTWTAGDYFQTMGIALLAGDVFRTEDQLTSSGKVVVSKSAADRLWPGEDPIGRRLQGQGQPGWATVVGVVEDVKQNDFRESPDPLLYFPMVGPTPTAWAISSPAYVMKTSRAEEIAPEVRALVREVAPEAPMYRIYTMAGLARESMVALSFTMQTLLLASTLALILGTVGLYGVLSYVVAERTREIGVRMALGAKAEQVRGMVVAQGARVVAIGVVIGIVAAIATTRALSSLLYGVQAIDASTFAGMSVSLIVVGLLASYMPARRASNVDPMESLRSD